MSVIKKEIVMKMKKFTLLALSFGLMTSCSEDGVSGFSENLTTTTVLETINSIAFEEDIDDLISESFDLSSKAISARSADAGLDKDTKKFKGDKYGECASVVVDKENNTKTITFSNECEGKRGQTRSGTMIVTYSEIQGEIGSFREVSYDDFYLNGVKIEGTRRTEILSTDENGSKTMRTTLTDGKMIYDDGTFKTTSAEMTRYIHVESDKKQYTTLSGSKSGVSTEGVSFSMEITTPIKFVYNCFDEGQRKRGKVPVQGIKVTNDGSQIITTDFGDGTCDTLVEITKDGEIETVDLKTLKRGDRFKNILKKKNKREKK